MLWVVFVFVGRELRELGDGIVLLLLLGVVDVDNVDDFRAKGGQFSGEICHLGRAHLGVAKYERGNQRRRWVSSLLHYRILNLIVECR